MNEETAHKQQKIQIKNVFFVIWEFMISRITHYTRFRFHSKLSILLLCHFSRKAKTGRNSPCPIKKTQSKSSEFLLVRIRGFEPPWSCPHTDLNRARLPIPPYPQVFCFPWRDYFIIHRFAIFASFFWNFSWFFSIFFLLFSEPLYFARLWVSLPNDSELSICSRFHRHVLGFKTTWIQSEIFNTDTYTLRSNFLSEYHPPC